VLVDTGFGGAYAARFMPGLAASPGHDPFAQLRALGVEPSKVTDVILTHTHFDHLSDLAHAYANARFYLQRKEFDFVSAPPHPWFREMVDWQVLSALAAEEGKLVLLDDEAEILPGIAVLPTPGHTFGHQSVLVETGSGRSCLAGDACFFQGNLDEDRAPGFNTSLIDCLASLAKLRKLQGEGVRILPGHDPLVLEEAR
jgi:glyoxylase-like metal-dependent hydrolase (beta-lactamase superfamily II)